MRRNNVIGHSPQIRTYFRRSCQRFESPYLHQV
jgi:hypothetical protein